MSTFLELQNLLIAARSNEADRGAAQFWLNWRLQVIWAREDWPFKLTGPVNVTATSGSNVVTGIPNDFVRATELYRDDGFKLGWMLPRDFNADYQGSTSRGLPVNYTQQGSTIYLGPTPDTTALYTMPYQRSFTAMVNDNDVPNIPAGFHPLIVLGGTASYLKMENDPTWQALEQEFEMGMAAMASEQMGAPENYAYGALAEQV